MVKIYGSSAQFREKTRAYDVPGDKGRLSHSTVLDRTEPGTESEGWRGKYQSHAG